jgi:hypothetical protein
MSLFCNSKLISNKRKSDKPGTGFFGSRWFYVGSAFPEPKTARKNVSANGNGESGGEVGVGKWRWMVVSD